MVASSYGRYLRQSLLAETEHVFDATNEKPVSDGGRCGDTCFTQIMSRDFGIRVGSLYHDRLSFARDEEDVVSDRDGRRVEALLVLMSPFDLAVCGIDAA